MSASEHDEAQEDARRTLRLTKSPTEFVPSTKRDIPETAGSDTSEMPAYGLEEVPSGQWGPQSFRHRWSPRSTVPFGVSEPTIDSTTDLQDFIEAYPSQPNRDVNLRELRNLEMPGPRPGSPDNDPEDLAALAEEVLSFKPAPPLAPPETMVIPEELQAFYNDSEVLATDRKRNLELFNTTTPATVEEAHKRGIGDYEYIMLQRRDLARRSVPSSTYPFYNGGQDINDSLDAWPIEVQRAVLRK